MVTYSSEFAHDLVSVLVEGEMEEGREQDLTLLERYRSGQAMNRDSVDDQEAD